MKGIFVNEDGVRYAEAIVDGRKKVETRSRNMLKSLVGDEVAIISTRRGCKPMVIGYATIEWNSYYPKSEMDKIRNYTLIPEGDKYDSTVNGKYVYWMSWARRCTPYLLPSSAVRHGRSWCEFDESEVK